MEVQTQQQFFMDAGSASSHKGRIIPDEWKCNIDRLLVEDLLNANRYFAQANPAIAQLVTREASRSPEDFYRELSTRWGWHHQFYELGLEPVLSLVLEPNHFGLSPTQVDALVGVYEAASLVDQATLPVSAAIKRHLDLWIAEESRHLTKEERMLLITPPVDSFWVVYHKDHLEYIRALKQGNPRASDLKQRLLDKYHASDEKIFEGRFQKFTKDFEGETDDIETQIKKLTQDESYWTRHLYFALERPRAQAIRDILIYDNREEYRILMSLLGISGYVLRKRVLGYLDQTRLLKNDGKIYEFADEIVLSGLKRLREYRSSLLHKSVKAYRQTGLTCGASSLMMALHYYGLSDLDQRTENSIHQSSKSSIVEGNHFSGLAKIAAALGLETVVLHSESEMFKNEGMFTESVFNNLMREYKSYLEDGSALGVQVLNGVDINIDLLKRYLANNYLVILGGHTGSFLHAILLVGYNDRSLVVRDPLDPSSQTYSNGYIESYLKTNIGSWALAVRRQQRALDDFLKKLPKFVEQARKYIST